MNVLKKSSQYTFILSILFLSVSVNISTYAQTLSPKKLKTRALEILKKYDAEGYQIISDYENGPTQFKIGNSTISFEAIGEENGFLFYIDGNTEKSIIEGINTAVHESNHGYTGRMIYPMLEKDPDLSYDFKSNYYAYFISSKEQILVKVTSTFPSRKMVSSFPKELRTFRFGTYIEDAPDMQSTQQHGIYGLLGELNSYYHGTKTSFLLYDYYQKELKTTGSGWLDYMQDVDGTLYACLEFKYYILKYLMYAKKKEQAIYNDIIGNRNFCEVFLKTEKNAARLAEDYFNKRKEILSDLKNKGIETSFTDEYTFIAGKGVGNFMDTYKLLKEELKKKEYLDLMTLIKKSL